MKFKVVSSIALVSCAFFGSLSASSAQEDLENLENTVVVENTEVKAVACKQASATEISVAEEN
ncbi:MAG: hypothetical protein KAH32_02550 [Chlamydiia bacterium]|nr:hypothetical protein [Chlamydiia bacterium]